MKKRRKKRRRYKINSGKDNKNEVVKSNEPKTYLNKVSKTDNYNDDIDKDISDKIKKTAIKAYKSLDCSGLSRVDFFLEKDTNRIILNEINTMPGFTTISMYPKLWESTGLSYSELLDKLISLALE